MTALVPAVSAPVQPSTQADTDAQLIELWLHGRSANTQAAYQHDIGKFFSLVGKPIREVTLRDFQTFADAIEGSVGTKRRVIAAVKSLFSFALKLGYVRFSVAAAVRAPKAMDTLAERILPEAKIHEMVAFDTGGPGPDAPAVARRHGRQGFRNLRYEVATHTGEWQFGPDHAVWQGR
jgi:integrase/recombinase XerD